MNWTLGAVDTHGAMFHFILGKWGEDATEADRVAACLEFQAGTGFIVRDSADRPAASSDLTERALRREEIIDTPLAQQLFDLVDAVWLQDDRIAEIREAQAKSR